MAASSNYWSQRTAQSCSKPETREALRAVTTNPAAEKGLNGQLGSIKPGKVADFVRLSDGPLDYA